MNIPFSPPYIDDSVIAEVVDSLKSGWITTGPKVKALEAEIKNFSGAGEVLCVNSLTSAAIMVLKWLGLKEGDEVIVPAYTYSATALAVIHAGGTPVMVDINDDFNISPDAIEKAITSKTKAIMPVDIAGYPCNYDKIAQIVESKKSLFTASSDVQSKLGRILVLSDAAHSLGAKYKNKYSGYNADIVLFSLHAVKNVTTAEGGAICINMPKPFDNTQLYSQLRLMTLNCQTKDALTKSKAGDWRYDIIGLGMKINMPDINAALGLAQMRQYGELLTRRKKIFERYSKAFSEIEWAITPPSTSEYAETSYHIYALRIKNFTEKQRDSLIDEISKTGVAVNVHFVPMPMFTYFKSLGYKIDNYPKAYLNYSCEISLPIYPQLTDEQADYVVDMVVKSFKLFNETNI